MSTILDTLKIAKRLEAAGFTDAQAETVADVLRETREADWAQIATKADLASLATKADLADLKAELAEMKADILKWVVTLLLGQASLVAALVKPL